MPSEENNNGAAVNGAAVATPDKPDTSTDTRLERAQRAVDRHTPKPSDDRPDGAAASDKEPEGVAEKTGEAEGGQAPPVFKADGDNLAFELTGKSKEFVEKLGLSDDDVLTTISSAYQRYQGLSEDEIVEGLTGEKAATFVERGLRLAKINHDFEELHGKLGRPVKQQSQGRPGEQPPDAEQPVDLSEKVKSAIGEVLETIGQDNAYSDLKEPLGILATSVAEVMQREHEAKYAQLAQQFQDFQDIQQDQQLDAMLNREMDLLVNDYPELSKRQTRDKVIDTFDALTADKDKAAKMFKSNEEVLNRAVQAILGEQSTTTIRKRLIDTAKSRKNGQPHVPEHKEQPQEPSDPRVRRELLARRALQKRGLPVD